MFDHLLELSHRDDSIKWSNIILGEEITQAVSIEVNFGHFRLKLILRILSGTLFYSNA